MSNYLGFAAQRTMTTYCSGEKRLEVQNTCIT
jgi:hypothetical protein